MADDHIISALTSVPPEGYGPKFQDHLLEQYKIYVESAREISDRRTTASNYLLTVNSLLVTLFGVTSFFQEKAVWQLAVMTAGVLVSILWHSLVCSYKNLNTAKFAVIHEIEQHLPLALFKHEWDLCDKGAGKIYVPLTHVERWIPIIFLSLYLVLGGYGVYDLWHNGDKPTAAPQIKLPTPAAPKAP